MEIDITDFVHWLDHAGTMQFSGSRIEHGQNAAKITWDNSIEQACETPLLTTLDQIDALRGHAKGFGAWSEDEIANWSHVECNALLIQMICGDLREAGMDDGIDQFDWHSYEEDAQSGILSGRIMRGDDGRIYYYLGE
jgi:hypothetical protein